MANPKKGILAEFRAFAMRGNVVDMAVGVIMGGAFGKIVSSLVGDLVMPLIGVLVGGVNFADLAVTLRPAQGEAEAVLFKYGQFIQNVIDFLLIAMVVFLMVKIFNRLAERRKKAEEEEAPPAPVEKPATEVLLTEIRDLLKDRK